MAGKVSDESPIGQSIFGKKVGDAVIIKTPKGEVKYKIISIN
jgi:transcription elongation factor GreA